MRAILLICSLLLCGPSFSQISVNKKVKSELIGAFKYMGTTYVECHKYPNDGSEDYYSFTFKNSKYTHIVDMQSFGFYDIDNAFESFSTMCLDGFENIPEDNYFSLSLTDGELIVVYTKSAGVLMMYFIYTENGVNSKTSWMTKKQAQKLFGKFKKKRRK